MLIVVFLRLSLSRSLSLSFQSVTHDDTFYSVCMHCTVARFICCQHYHYRRSSLHRMSSLYSCHLVFIYAQLSSGGIEREEEIHHESEPTNAEEKKKKEKENVLSVVSSHRLFILNAANEVAICSVDVKTNSTCALFTLGDEHKRREGAIATREKRMSLADAFLTSV